MKKYIALLLIISVFAFLGCKGGGETDNKSYKLKLNVPDNTWTVSKLSVPDTQIIEKKGSLGTVSIMSAKVDEKDVPGVTKKSLDDVFSILKSKTAKQKTGIKVKELGSKIFNTVNWRGIQITFEKTAQNLGNIIQTIYITKKGQSAFMVVLHAPPKKDAEAKKELESTLNKVAFVEVK